MNELIKQYFDKVAPTYVHNENEVMESLLNSLELKHFHRILDLGAGKGIISEKLYERSKGEVIALDLSSVMVELAKKNHPHSHVKFINGDFYEYKDEKFDAIIVFDAYPHFMDKDGFIEKANELLNKDGMLAIIHDIPRETLNIHHMKNAGTVSRKLEEPEKELIPFLKYFKPIEAWEDDKQYKIILIKK